MARIFLILCALAFVAIGLNTFRDPVLALAPVELTASTVSALNELRANYGGLQIGMGLFLAAGALVPSLQRGALLGQALLVGGLAGGRVVSIAQDGLPNAFVVGLLALEASIALISVLLYGRASAR